MKKELKDIEKLVGDFIAGGNDISSLSTLPPVGVEIQLENIDGRTFHDRATQADVDNGSAKAVGEEMSGEDHTHKFLAGEFTPSGTLSLATLLRSPELTWAPELNTKSLRIEALQNAKLMFCAKEIAKSKSGRTYNIYHMRPQLIGTPESTK